MLDKKLTEEDCPSIVKDCSERTMEERGKRKLQLRFDIKVNNKYETPIRMTKIK